MRASNAIIRHLLSAALALTSCGALFAEPAVGQPASGQAAAGQSVNEIRIYALDCGHLEFKNKAFFSDTGDYDGKTAAIAVPCFLIRHPKGNLMWDTGLSADFAKRPANSDGVTGGLDVPVEKQLLQIGMKPADVKFLAFSHLHIDHTGNANLFASATWILNKTELAWATTGASGSPVDLATFSGYKTAKTHMIDGDYDVFGDGTVRILKTPGHTPGHQVLVLKLKTAGTVILAGDLYHFRSDRTDRLIPLFNTDRADTLASFDRVEKLARNTKARLIIQHDPDDFKSLPKFPAYLN